MKKISLIIGSLSTFLGMLSSPLAAQDMNNSYCSNKVTLGGEWLYWQLEQSNMDVAYLTNSTGTVTAENGDVTVLEETSSSIHPTPQYHSGFRAKLGCELPGNGWELGAVYSYIPSHTKKSVRPKLGGNTIVLSDYNFPILGNLSTTTPSYSTLNSINTKWVSYIHNLDVDVANTICIGESFYIRPHCGFRSTWMNQRYRLSGNSVVANAQLNPTLVEAKFTETVYGYGVEGGLWANWNIGGGFALVGHVGGSLLYTKFSVNQKVDVSTIGAEDAVTTFAKLHNHNTKRLGMPTMDYYLGLEYISVFCEMELHAHVGWEQHTMFDANQMSANSGNLASQGLALGLDLAF